jgi:hypothetical protein
MPGTNAPALSAVTAAVGATLTAAQLLAGVIVRSGPTAAFTDTTDTASAIQAALGYGSSYGQSLLFTIENNAAFSLTLANGTGVTVAGVTTVGANSFGVFLLQSVSAGAVTITGIYAAYGQVSGIDPSTCQTQFGSSTASFLEEGNIFRVGYNPASALAPAGTAADVIVAVYTMPANAFDVAGRSVWFTVSGATANNGNTKRAKIIFNAAAPVIGQTVSGGTTIADTGACTNALAGWTLGAIVQKTGAAGSNTQVTIHQAAQCGNTLGTLVPPAALTAPENATINFVVTINCTTTATDMVLNLIQVNGMN